MTKVAFKGPVNGTGTYTLRAPETASTLELELPTAGTHLAGAQADGMPLIADGTLVVESGSNTDGRWVRWADGAQVCYADLLAPGLWTFPRAFAGGISITTTNRSSGPRFNSISGVSGTEVTVHAWDNTGTSSSSNGDILATGRWK